MFYNFGNDEEEKELSKAEICEILHFPFKIQNFWIMENLFLFLNTLLKCVYNS